MEINGEEAGDIESLDYTVNENLTRVETMTRNRRSAGFRKGNMGINLNVTMAVQFDKPALAVRLLPPINTPFLSNVAASLKPNFCIDFSSNAFPCWDPLLKFFSSNFKSVILFLAIVKKISYTKVIKIITI